MQRDAHTRTGRTVWPWVLVVSCLGCVIAVQALVHGHFSRMTLRASTAEIPAALMGPQRGGFTVVRRFAAISQLTGWVLRAPDGRYDVVYTTPDGRALISGRVLTSSGENLTDYYAALYVPKFDAQAFWKRLEVEATVVVAGSRHPRSIIYVVMDPNCIFCHMLWVTLRRYEAAGLQVRWIPVGFLHKDSAAKAAAVVDGGEPVLSEMQEKFDVHLESGGVPGIAITPKVGRELDANLALMHEAHILGTPGIIYRDAAGRVHIEFGLPTKQQLQAITWAEQPRRVTAVPPRETGARVMRTSTRCHASRCWRVAARRAGTADRRTRRAARNAPRCDRYRWS